MHSCDDCKRRHDDSMRSLIRITLGLVLWFVWAGVKATLVLVSTPKADQASVPRPPARPGVCTLSNKPWRGSFVVRTWSDQQQEEPCWCESVVCWLLLLYLFTSHSFVGFSPHVNSDKLKSSYTTGNTFQDTSGQWVTWICSCRCEDVKAP